MRRGNLQGHENKVSRLSASFIINMTMFKFKNPT